MKNKLIAEFIGTYLLYTIIAICNLKPGAGMFTPIAVGIGLAALVYSCGHISKAHFNPATTLAYFVAGTHSRSSIFPYLVVIFAAAILGAYTVQILTPTGSYHDLTLNIDPHRVILAEFIFTFFLMWVILNVAIAQGTAKNQFYGIAIGAVVTSGAYAVGPISFAVFNPAVTLALCINGFLPWDALPLYVLTQAFAALVAGLLFRSMNITSPSELIQRGEMNVSCTERRFD